MIAINSCKLKVIILSIFFGNKKIKQLLKIRFFIHSYLMIVHRMVPTYNIIQKLLQYLRDNTSITKLPAPFGEIYMSEYNNTDLTI